MTKTPDNKCPCRCIVSRHYSECIRFYKRVLSELGMQALLVEEGATGFGHDTPGFWVRRGAENEQPRSSLYFQAHSKEAVYNFFASAFESGGFCLDAPDTRKNSFNCKIKDPVGNVVQACFQL